MNQVSEARIGWANMGPRRLGPAETTEAENEKNPECCENEDIGENGDGLKKLKHGQPPWQAVVLSINGLTYDTTASQAVPNCSVWKN